MSEKLNLIFMPVSILNGMANSKRLQNFYIHIKNNKAISVHNLVHESNNERKKTVLTYQNIEGLNYYKIEYNYKRILDLFKLFWLTFKVFIRVHENNHNNILYHSGYPNIRNILFIVFSKILRYKIVFDIIEDNSSIKSFKSPVQKIKNKSSLIFFKYLYLFANGIVCISESTYKIIQKINKDRVPIIKIPISVDKRYFSGNTKKTNTQKSTVLFYGGSFGEKDGIDYLLTAFDCLAEGNDVQLVMTGEGNNHDMTVFYNKLGKLKNKDKVHYKGYLEDSFYYELLQTADIHCMVRTNSDFANAGFPFKLGEMLATGKPVIVTKVSDVEKYLTPNDAFLIEPECVAEIVKTVLYILEHPSVSKEIGRNGKEASLKYFDSERIADNFIEFIQNKVK